MKESRCSEKARTQSQSDPETARPQRMCDLGENTGLSTGGGKGLSSISIKSLWTR